MRVALILLVLAAACGTGRPAVDAPDRDAQALLAHIANTPAPRGDDQFEVWVCAVPLPTVDPVYGDLTLRLELTPAHIAAQLNDQVTAYFNALSHGAYRPVFRAGGTIELGAGQTHDRCVAQAAEASASSADAILVVANAEHTADSPGGWGRSGTPCASARCPARVTGRAAYVGASDFNPVWNDRPAADLIEHEIGHTLGLVHSGDDQHDSALDVMSNSAAPRDVDGQRRDGPGTLAINRVALGWLPTADVAVASRRGGSFTLSPSGGTAGTRLLVLPIDAQQLLTVEYLTNDGFDDFLPESGLAVHLVDAAAPDLHRTLGADAPFTDLVDRVGDSVSARGWTITLTTIGAEVNVDAVPTNR